MDGRPLDMVEIESMPSEKTIESSDGEIAEMLMVNGVKLAVVNQIDDIGHFNDGDARVLQQQTNTRHKAVEIGHMSQHIISQKYVGSISLLHELSG